MHIYFYDLFEFDSPFEEINSEFKVMEKTHRQRLLKMKTNHSALYRFLYENQNTEMFDKLFGSTEQGNSLVSLVKKTKTRTKPVSQSERTLIQFSIMLKDDSFVDFIQDFPKRLTEYFEEHCELLSLVEDKHIELIDQINKASSFISETFTIDTSLNVPNKHFSQYESLKLQRLEKLQKQKELQIELEQQKLNKQLEIDNLREQELKDKLEQERMHKLKLQEEKKEKQRQDNLNQKQTEQIVPIEISQDHKQIFGDFEEGAIEHSIPAGKYEFMTTEFKKQEKDRAELTFDEARDSATEYYNYMNNSSVPAKPNEINRNRKKLMLSLTGVYNNEDKELDVTLDVNQSKITINEENNESFITNLVENKKLLEPRMQKKRIKRIKPFLIKILAKQEKKQRTVLGMLYAGFYSLRYNAQENFGSKFGRRNTPEKRLKDDISDTSDNISNYKGNAFSKHYAGNDDELSEINHSNLMTPHLKDDSTNTIFKGFSELKNQTDISNISQISKTRLKDGDMTNVTDINANQGLSDFVQKKLYFEDEKIDSDEFVRLKDNRLRDSNRFFGKIQLLGKKKKEVRQGKLHTGLLILQPGPKIKTGLYDTRRNQYFNNPFRDS